MSIAIDIAADLPYLRRFARSLCGSQASGDAYVMATLEMLLENPDAFPRDMSPRVALYRLFVGYWSSFDLNTGRVNDEDIARARNVQKLTPRARQAFLLRHVEGFTLDEVAQILSVSPSCAQTYLAAAGREIVRQVATDVLIIEDESVIAADIGFLVSDLGHRIVGVARTHREATALVAKKSPGLVLADIHLGDGSSGLRAVNEILHGVEVPVIFITGLPERLLTGETPEPTFLVTKPYRAEVVKTLISQALFFEHKAKPSAAWLA